MSDRYDHELTCPCCDRGLRLDFSDAAAAVVAMRTFFVEHGRCQRSGQVEQRRLVAA